jgi:hypothetical protein
VKSEPAPLRTLGVGVVIAAALTAAVFLFPRAFSLASGPDVEVITALKKAEARGLELEVGDAGTLYSKQVFFERMQVTVVSNVAARVNCTLDFTGHLGDTEVSSLGLERIGFQLEGGDWKPVTNFAPRLLRTTWALEQRRRAIEAADRGTLVAMMADGGTLSPELDPIFSLENRRYRALRWLIRFEREGATVTEEYRLEGNSADRPVDQKGSVRLFVDPDREFFFPQGLM